MNFIKRLVALLIVFTMLMSMPSFADEAEDIYAYLSSLGINFLYEEWSGSHEWRFWIQSIFKACVLMWGEPPARNQLDALKNKR